ncbi:retrovirus-related pol polyprotein from transposon TNT 1-94 [Tanacetum coccineum]
MSRATSIKSWLWHRRLSHLHFGAINQLMSKDLVDGLLKFKYNKDHLCSACEQDKSKKASLPSKLVPSTESKLELLHMDLSDVSIWVLGMDPQVKVQDPMESLEQVSMQQYEVQTSASDLSQ